jgi:hypothetical protein
MTDQPTPEQQLAKVFCIYLDALQVASAAGVDAHAGAPHLPPALQKGTPITLGEALSLSPRDIVFILHGGAVAHVSTANAAAVEAFLAQKRLLAQAVADGWAQHRRAAEAR